MNSFKPAPGRVYKVHELASWKTQFNIVTNRWEPQTPERDLLLMIIAIYPDLTNKRRHAKKNVHVSGWSILVFWLSDAKLPRVERVYVGKNDKKWTPVF